MINFVRGVIFAIIIPILSLASLTIYKRHILTTGEEVTLKITGYDPRDLLSGHYLTYRVEYGVDNICPRTYSNRSGFVCLSSKKFSYRWPENCKLMIQGKCDGRLFRAGIERFYISEDQAKKLDRIVRDSKASIRLSVPANGKAIVAFQDFSFKTLKSFRKE
jgi:uncharacterized membrane-anchored protein